jgi:hypothetical protein
MRLQIKIKGDMMNDAKPDTTRNPETGQLEDGTEQDLKHLSEVPKQNKKTTIADNEKE